MTNKKLILYDIGNIREKRQIFFDEVHLWLINLNDEKLRNEFSVSELSELLNQDEREKLSKYIFNEQRERFLYGRGILKLLIANYLFIDPREVLIGYNDKGKPILRADINLMNLNFNLSHSNNYLIIGFTLENSIGVDIEYIDKSRNIMGIARRFFNLEEYNKIKCFKGMEQLIIFYILWTFKEAYLKCIGSGINNEFKNITLTPINPRDINHKIARLYKHNGKTCKYYSLKINNGYIINIVFI
jgi:4'-phosphopantetheinyl transferase